MVGNGEGKCKKQVERYMESSGENFFFQTSEHIRRKKRKHKASLYFFILAFFTLQIYIYL